MRKRGWNLFNDEQIAAAVKKYEDIKAKSEAIGADERMKFIYAELSKLTTDELHMIIGSGVVI